MRTPDEMVTWFGGEAKVAREEAAPPQVLVVDERDASREELASLLGEQGYAISQARTGLHLLDQIGASLLPDSVLPAPDAVVAVVRERGVTLESLAGLARRGWNVPVIVIKATRDAVVHQRLMDLETAVAVLDAENDAVEDLVVTMETYVPT